MVDLVFYQVLFLNTLTRHYDIVIVFPCLYHRLIQYLIDPPFLYLLFLYGTLHLHLSHLHLQLLLSSPLSLLICINSLCLFIYFVFVYCSPFYFHLLFTIPIMLTSLSCNKIWIEKYCSWYL